MKKILLNAALMGGICFVQAQSPDSSRHAGSPSTVTYYRNNSYLNAEEDSSVNPVQTVITYKNGSLYHIRMTGEKMIELSVDGRKIPADSFHVYDALARKLALQIKEDKAEARLDKEQAERDELQAGRDRLQAEKDEVQSKEDREQAERDRLQEKLDVEQAIRDKQQEEVEKTEARIEKIEAEKEKEIALVEAKVMAEDRVQAVRDRAQAVEDRKQAERDRKQAERDRIQAVEDRKQAERDRVQAAEDRAILKKLIGEIIKEGLVPDEKSLRSLSLDEDGFIINGKQQSDVLKNKFQEKFLVKPGYSISFRKGSMQLTR